MKSSQAQKSDGRMKLNGLWIAGLLINTAATALVFFVYGPIPGAVSAAFLVLCYLGTALALLDNGKAAAAILMIGTLAFIPIGVIGLFGFRKAQEAVTEYAFFKNAGEKPR